jgi:hypothetical protein
VAEEATGRVEPGDERAEVSCLPTRPSTVLPCSGSAPFAALLGRQRSVERGQSLDLPACASKRVMNGPYSSDTQNVPSRTATRPSES